VHGVWDDLAEHLCRAGSRMFSSVFVVSSGCWHSTIVHSDVKGTSKAPDIFLWALSKESNTMLYYAVGSEAKNEYLRLKPRVPDIVQRIFAFDQSCNVLLECAEYE
jgi:hypothetical protein